MANRSYTTKEINERLYELRPTQSDSKPIGLVPVIARIPNIDALEQLGDLVSSGAYTADDIFATWQNGHAVNQQARARQAVSPGKNGPTAAQTVEIFNLLSRKDEKFCRRIVGHADIMNAEIREYWKANYQDGKTAVEASPNKVWETLALPVPSK
jgi:hypothetical protein